MSNQQNPPPAPNHDETNRLLATIIPNYSWTAFKPILYSPDKLRAWILENLTPDPQDLEMHPDDPRVAEMSVLNVGLEDEANEFWGELTKEEREMMQAAFVEIWGRAGKAALP